MNNEAGNMFIKDNSVSKQEFMAQFEGESMEIVVRIRDIWKKGRKPFPKFGRESLASADYNMPWLADQALRNGPYGKLFWFCKKSLFGYPYKPEFNDHRICLYRLRVRKARFLDKPRAEHYFLEEILEENVDLIKDDEVYKNALGRYFADTDVKITEMTVLINHDFDISKREFLHPYSVNNFIAGFKAVRFADSGKARMIDGQLEIPFDARDFIGNRNLKISAGSIIKITARKRTAPEKENFFVLDQLLETGVKDNELRSLGKEANTPGTWHIDGVEDDFDVNDGEAVGWVTFDNGNDVQVTLACDDDNLRSAASATPHLMKILENQAAFEAKVFEAVFEDLGNKDGTINTREGENMSSVTISKDEFIKRLRISDLWINPDGSGAVRVNLNSMFTDHACNVAIYADGTCESQGLIG